MGADLSESQNAQVVLAERITSAISLTGLAFIFFTFTFSPNFRKPINRLMFYAAWGDALYNISTLIATSGIAAGADSTICQFQGFMIEMFLLSDILWNLSMAINVWLTVFAKYDSAKLKSLETRYLCINYGIPFIISFTLCFINSETKGKVYGPALIWCWMSIDWDALRIALLYAPAWVIILCIGIIYLVSGREINRKRRELEDFAANNATISTICSAGEPGMLPNWKGTNVQVTTELSHSVSDEMAIEAGIANRNYSVTIEGHKRGSRPFLLPFSTSYRQRSSRKVSAQERTSAAWSYTKCAILFFVALLITWLPSSINRVYSLINPTAINWPLNLSAAIVLPLMGFWNTVIYVFISWRAVRELFRDVAAFSIFDSNMWSSRWRVPPGLARTRGPSQEGVIGNKAPIGTDGAEAQQGDGPWQMVRGAGSGSLREGDEETASREGTGSMVNLTV